MFRSFASPSNPNRGRSCFPRAYRNHQSCLFTLKIAQKLRTKLDKDNEQVCFDCSTHILVDKKCQPIIPTDFPSLPMGCPFKLLSLKANHTRSESFEWVDPVESACIFYGGCPFPVVKWGVFTLQYIVEQSDTLVRCCIIYPTFQQKMFVILGKGEGSLFCRNSHFEFH